MCIHIYAFKYNMNTIQKTDTTDIEKQALCKKSNK